VTKRILARLTGIPADKQRGGRVSHQEMLALAEASREVDELLLHIDDTPAPTVDAISARARRLKRRKGLGLIIVDYLQLIAPGNSRNRRNANRTEDVTEISRALKVLAKDLGVPVIALSQLSRQVESRDDKRPQLSDLRESGAIEQDADLVAFLYREEYYKEREEPKERSGEDAARFAERVGKHQDQLRACRGIAELIVAKNRMGPTGALRLFYQPAQSRFGNLAVVAGQAVGA
jgi:replicative DNA helicase